MVRLLKDLKVAEVRKQLTDKGESAEGKKPVLIQVCFTIRFILPLLMLFRSDYLIGWKITTMTQTHSILTQSRKSPRTPCQLRLPKKFLN